MKTLYIILIILLIANMTLLALGKISVFVFWLIIGLAWLLTKSLKRLL